MHRFGRISVVLAFGIVACGGKEPAATSSQQPATPAVSKPASPVAPAPSTASAVPVAPASGAIAGSDGERTGSHIDVTELKRGSGGTVTLKFVLTNGADKKFDMWGHYLGDQDVSKDSYKDVSGIHLLDPVNKKKYFVVTDAEKKCVCSANIEDVPAGGRVSLWAKFPAPPPEVTKVTVEIPHFQPMDDVPISQ